MIDGHIIKSTHIGNAPIPELPLEEIQSHILPGLKKYLLLSIRQLCDHGCNVKFTKTKCNIYYKNSIILSGPRDPTTELWIIDLPVTNNNIRTPLQAATNEGESRTPIYNNNTIQMHCNNAYTINTKKELIRFLHAACFSPTKATWIKAINNNQFATWPGINAADVTKYLPPSMATTKGHMKMHRKNVRSTRNNNKIIMIQMIIQYILI